MLCAQVVSFNRDDPLAGLRVGEAALRSPQPGWVPVRVRAAAVNHHDLWSLRGVGLSAGQLPMVLGTDAAGVDPGGREVLVHAVIADPALTDETLDPARSLLSERYPGTFAERLWVPARNLVARHPALSAEEAACLPTAYLTAWRMLTRAPELTPGARVLVQGSTGGVATASIQLGAALGLSVWATSRTAAGRRFARALGAEDAFEPGSRLPAPVDAVVESVGEATWAHSVRSLRPGGSVLLCGATTGGMPPAMLSHIFFRSLRVIGSTMGTLGELIALQEFLAVSGVRPVIAHVRPLQEAGAALRRLLDGTTRGKEVLTLP